MSTLDQVLDSQTPFCQHKHGCVRSALLQTLKNAKYGAVIAAVLQLLRTLKMASKDPKKWRSSLRPQYLSIALFLSATVLVLRGMRCALRRIRGKDDGWNSFGAGAAAGWVASKTLTTDYWYFYLTFLGSRVIGAGHKYLIQQGVLS